MSAVQALRNKAHSRLKRMLGRHFQTIQRAKRRLTLRKDSGYDAKRFARYSTAVRAPHDQESLASLITIDYHRVEKGLALPAPRPGFGRDVVARLIEMTRDHEARFGPALATTRARHALAEYVVFNRAQDQAIPQSISDFLHSDTQAEATFSMTKAELAAATDLDFDRFLHARRSVRQYTGDPVDPALIRRAVGQAQESPSVCNRQSGRVHAVFGRDAIAKALKFQNGNAGYGDLAGALMIVTSDMRTFASPGERNQCFVDGGLFAMTLNYALHAQNLGTCMLNWSVNGDVDRAMRRAMGIPDHEAVITMMAVGHLPDTFSVARSARRDLDEVLREITS